MRVVSIGDLVTDYYYKNGKLIGVNGGMTSHNIIANLAKAGIKTSVFACCGDDPQGEIAIKSLEKINVDVNNIKVVKDIRTRCFHVSYFDDGKKLSFTSKKRCPFCNNKKWYEESLLDTDFILSNIKFDDILVFDNLNEKNQIIIDNTMNKKIIDLGQYFEFEKLSNEEIINKLDTIDTLINCAGIISSGEESEKYDCLELNDIINTNLKSTLRICLQMIDKWNNSNTKGNIINIGSIAARNGSKYFPIYSSTKAGIVAFSKSIASRYGEYGIRCNVISPGVIKTPMSYIETPNFDDYIEEIEDKTPLKRLGNPDDIAKVALFLASDNSEFITGQEIIVDGGYTLSQE